MNRISAWFDSLPKLHRGIFFFMLVFGWLIPAFLFGKSENIIDNLVLGTWVLAAMAFCVYRMARN